MSDAILIPSFNLPIGDVIVLRRTTAVMDPRKGVFVNGNVYELLEHRPCPIGRGDLVKTDTGYEAKVVFVHEDTAWIKYPDKSNGICQLTQLTRI